MKKNRIWAAKISFALVLTLNLFNLVYIFIFKYNHLHIEFKDFQIMAPANLFNIIPGIVVLLLLLGAKFVQKKYFPVHQLLTYTVVSTASLLTAALAINFKITIFKIDFLDHPYYEISAGIFFFVFQFMQFFILIYLLQCLFKKRGKKVFFMSLVWGLILFVIIFIFAFWKTYDTEIQINKTNLDKNNNVAVVLGAAVWKKNKPSPTLEARINKAYELYQEGYVAKIQLTGGHAPGEVSEAEAGYLYLKQKGIDPDVLQLEDSTSSTKQQIEFIKRNLKDFNTIIIVSDSYHLPRVDEICKIYNLNVNLVASDLKMSFSSFLFYRVREAIGLFVFWFFGL
ncbi:MAG: YdcF family protein [Bacteroidota bacterium]|nr:YdcF family protein [Bacteroidota bacterium]